MSQHRKFRSIDSPRPAPILIDYSELTVMELGTLVTTYREAMAHARLRQMRYEFTMLYLEARAVFLRRFFEVQP